uniref:Serine/threonine-protein kinase RIO3 n=1 Tax=Eptatretus burgeri TaxID=7764 RepID=A0A8C4NC89_EPTBU
MASLVAIENEPKDHTETPKCPWATTSIIPCSLVDVMCEELSKQHQEQFEEVQHVISASQPHEEVAVDEQTANDLMLATLMQMDFDREFDAQVRTKEQKYNGNKKVTVSLKNFRPGHGCNGGDSHDEKDDSDEEMEMFGEPYTAEKSQIMQLTKLKKKETNFITKHDAVLWGRKNMARTDHFPPEFCSGDRVGMDLKLPNPVFNFLKAHFAAEQRKSARVHDKKEIATSDHVLDMKTRLIIYRMVNNGVLDSIGGCISTGKESVVLHASGGSLDGTRDPRSYAVKVFKTSLNEFQNRSHYIRDDYRFKDRFSKLNPRKIIHLWAEKECRNLHRMRHVGLRCPEVLLLKKHVLVISFIGEGCVPAPKLVEVKLNPQEMQEAYGQVRQMMRTLYQECHLVHADLSAYNLLWFVGQVWMIDVSQSVDTTHPHALEFLYRDCRNVTQFFQKAGIHDNVNECDLFNSVSGLDIPITDEISFMAEIECLERMNVAHAQRKMKKNMEWLFQSC